MNEPGPAIGAEDWERYEAAVAARLEGHGVLVCSGSVPPGTPPDAYGRLVELAAACRRGGDRGRVRSRAGRRAAERSRRRLPEPRRGRGAAARSAPTRRSSAGDPGEARARAADAAVELVRRGARAAVVTRRRRGRGRGRRLDGQLAPGACASPSATRSAPATRSSAGWPRPSSGGSRSSERCRAGLATAAASVETATAGEIDPARAAELEAAAASPQRVAR